MRANVHYSYIASCLMKRLQIQYRAITLAGRTLWCCVQSNHITKCRNSFNVLKEELQLMLILTQFLAPAIAITRIRMHH